MKAKKHRVSMINFEKLLITILLISIVSCQNSGKTVKAEGETIEQNDGTKMNIGIEFSEESFKKAVKISKEHNRPIFIDFSTSWCGPCKKMKNFVYTDSIIGDFYNKNFICLKYDAEKGEGITLAKKFEIKAYPTLLFLSPQLEIELKRIGFKAPKEFLELGYTVVNEKPSSNTIQNSIYKDNSNTTTLIEFDSFLNGMNLYEKDPVLVDYFQDIPKSKWYAPQYFGLIEDYSSSIFSPLSKFVVVNRGKYSELYGKERIDKFISGLMSFAFKMPKDLYGKSYVNLSDYEINKLLFNELEKIDSVFASKNRLDHEIILLCKNVKENYNNTELWDSLFTKVEYYNKHYSNFDKEWYNFPNKWYYRASKIASNNLEKKNYNEISLKLTKSRLSESDYNEFAEVLCIGTVERFVSSKKETENSKKELTIALRILAESYPVSKAWANQFLTRINVSDKDIINYKEELIKNSL